MRQHRGHSVGDEVADRGSVGEPVHEVVVVAEVVESAGGHEHLVEHGCGADVLGGGGKGLGGEGGRGGGGVGGGY